VRCFPHGLSSPGFVIGSIEGRVGVKSVLHRQNLLGTWDSSREISYIDGAETDNFSFKCHRVEKTPKPIGVDKPSHDI